MASDLSPWTAAKRRGGAQKVKSEARCRRSEVEGLRSGVGAPVVLRPTIVTCAPASTSEAQNSDAIIAASRVFSSTERLSMAKRRGPGKPRHQPLARAETVIIKDHRVRTIE